MTWLKNKLVYIGIGAVVLIVGFLGYQFWSLHREIDKLTEEKNNLTSEIVNHQIEASIHGSVEESTSGIKTSGEASARLNNIVNRKMEGR
jgi:regulatory protein YycI of two-component signal transduction system YycFG